jgi:hypothetical protein
VPSPIAPPMNFSFPVGTPAVTACPTADGFCEELSNSVVAAMFTTCPRTGEVLPAQLLSPLSDPITANYLGTTNYGTSSASLTQVVQ